MGGRTCVVVGVSGGIAAYKACELVRELQRAGMRVKVVMTESATRFVGPLTFRTLTGEPVAVSMWDDPTTQVHHVSLAQEADVMVIAPCTANVIAKLVHGRADDLLTTTTLATEAPVVIAPAMNTRMYRKEITQRNLQALRDRGMVIVEPESGELACGDVGEGRLASVGTIAEATLVEAQRVRDLAGVRVLVTAGPTYEAIDPVRYIGNHSSGKTGYAVAEEAARRGADVTLVSGPTALPDPWGCLTVRVRSAREMQEAVANAYGATDVVIAAAAVADFRPAEVALQKLKKEEAPDVLVLERNPDILAGLGRDKGSRILVGFAAETTDVLAHARKKLAGKNLDMIVANDVSKPGLGFGVDRNEVTFVTQAGEEFCAPCGKREIAQALLDRVRILLDQR